MIPFSHFIPYFLLLFIGVANALPVPVLASNLSLYLADLGLGTDTIGLFSLLGLPYCVKLLWAPLIDNFTLPFFAHSPRKGWMIFALAGMALSFFGLSLAGTNLWLFAGALLSLSTFTSCLYMVGLAYELESIDESRYSMGSAAIVSGYRAGLLFAGAGILYIAHLYSWSAAFNSAATILLFGCIAIFLQPEPYKSHETLKAKRAQFALYPSLKLGFWHEIILKPSKDFFQKQDWFSVIAILILFKTGNHIVKAVEGPFYMDIGFDKADLALASKTWGFTTAIVGAFIAGIFLKNKNHKMSVALLGVVHACSLLTYWVQAIASKSYFWLYLTTTMGNFTGGMAMTAFTLCLWKSCSKQYATVQYALFWSLFSLNIHLLSCFGGLLASTYCWETFFLLTSGIGIFTSLLLLGWVARSNRYLKQNLYPIPSP